SPRTPDCTPLDFIFWAYLKGKLYGFERIPNIDELRRRILQYAAEIPPEVLRTVINDEVEKRLRACVVARGDLFEYLLK
ncbi:uncharacterized protein LOC127276966, partial [Leptopilina boulardi]|uniref:uncharacterized protein LOC127276966 n=1 Tax=Leptopilina boulardi TaxID=63433 RepID=UPI0021F5A183